MGIGSALVGGLIGSLTARGITRRLERVSGVAQQWAAGKLSASIVEGPADELGQLERSLNQMALRLEHVFTLQNQVATLQERERITHDLHDTLKQEVFASTMLLGTAQEQLERGQLESLRASLAQLDALAEQLQTNLSAILKALPFSADAQELPELPPPLAGRVVAAQRDREHGHRYRADTSAPAGKPAPNPLDSLRSARKCLPPQWRDFGHFWSWARANDTLPYASTTTGAGS